MNIQLKNVIAGYSKDVPAISIDNLLILNSDKFLIINGSNSSGKTTFLKSLIKGVPYNSGEIYYDDVLLTSTTRTEIVKKMGFCLIPGLSYTNLSLTQNLKLYKNLYNYYSEHFVIELVIKLNFEKYMNVKISSLSIGKKKIADFIISVFHKPQIVILDEPTSNLDEDFINIFINTISFLNRDEGMQFIIATNNLSNFKNLDFKEICIEDGRIKE